MSRQLYTFTLTVQGSSPKALLVTDGIEEDWLPKSRVACLDEKSLDELEPGDVATIMVEEWLAKKKGLI